MNHGASAVLLARRVDNFALGCVDDNIAQEIMTRIQLPSEAKISITFQGILSSFNGYNVLQTADYIQLSAESYLRRVFKSHAWEKPAKRESSLTAQPKSPLTNEEAKILYTVQPGPKEGSPEHAKLAHDVGYGHRTSWVRFSMHLFCVAWISLLSLPHWRNFRSIQLLNSIKR